MKLNNLRALVKEEITKKLSKAKTDNEMKTLTNSLDNINDQLKTMELKLKECKENEINLKKQIDE